MSRLEELIQELCPDGVEYKRFDEVCSLHARIGWQRLTREEYRDNGDYLLITGTDFTETHEIDYDRCVYVSEERYIQDPHIQLKNGDVLITKDGTLGKVAQVNNLKMPATLNGGIFVVRCIDNSLENRFILHYLLSDHFKRVVEQQKTGSTISHLTQALFSRLLIPVPPLEVQSEIVRILDNFTKLTAKLTAELTDELAARKQQYEYYRDEILEQPKTYVDMVPISSLGKWKGGKTPSMANKEFWDNGTIPWISSKDMKTSVLEDTENHITGKALSEGGMTLFPENLIVIVTRSGILKHTLPVAYVPFRTTINQDIKAMEAREGVLPKYAFHVLKAYGEEILNKTKKQGGTVDSLDFQKVLKYKVPLPSMDIQKRLVEVLDNFEAICSDLNIGLPSEIEARKKQYEYYRDKLLTFDMSDVTICRNGTERNGTERNGTERNGTERNGTERNGTD